ncbi:MAG: AsmA family protein [Alphaproteobacteria bacterium]|nr:AsmA family protein [Alphaproteobacteria bacterium]
MSRRRRVWVSVLGVIVVAVIVLALVWNWDWFIPPVQRMASQALGRPVTVQHLHLRLARAPVLEADGIIVANPPDFPADAPLARIEKLAVTVDALAYIRSRKLVLPAIVVDRANIAATQLADGRNNWTFPTGGAGGDQKPPAPLPDIGRLVINDSHVHALVPSLKSDFTLDVATRPAPGPVPRDEREGDVLTADIHGTYAAQPITGRFTGGTLLSLRDTDRPYPVDLHLANGGTQVTLKGTVRNPMALAGADLTLEVHGPSLDRLTPLSGVALPQTPPFRLTSDVDFADRRANLRKIDGRIGHSDIAGEASMAPGPERPQLSGDFVSHSIDLDDFAGVLGATPGGVTTPEQKKELAKQRASPKLLPDVPLALPKLRFADVDVRYKGEHIKGRSMPFDNIVAHVTIKDGAVRVHPARLAVGSGGIEADVTAVPQNDTALRTHTTVDFNRVDLHRLMAATHIFGGAGTIGGRAEIEGTGRSVAEILGHGDGDLKLFMSGGDISALLVDLSGLEFANALLSALGIPQRTPIRCMVTNFVLRRGIVDTRVMVLDTKAANVTGSGTINLRSEALDLQLKTEAKHFSIGSLPGPINIGGTLKNPSIRPGAETVARGAAAGVLGALLTPLAALLPTIQLGLGEDNNCAALIRETRRAPTPAEGKREAQ